MKRKSYIILSLILFFALASTASAGELVYVEGIDDRAEASYANTNGNTDTTTMSGKIKVSRYIEDFKITGNGAILRTESNDVETEDKLKLEILAEKDITDRLYGIGSLIYLRDTFSGYNFRIFIGPGVGYTFIDSEERLIQGTASLLYNYDDYSAGVNDKDETVSLKLTGKYSQHITESISFKQLLVYTLSLQDGNKSFVDSETRLETRLNDTFSIAVSYIINFQNEPPAGSIDETDTTLFTSIIADF